MARNMQRSSHKAYRQKFSSRDELLAYVASLYYEHGSNQSQIASMVGLSRPMVSRLLAEARERGMVEIKIHWPISTDSDLEKRLIVEFGLQMARVLDVEHLPYLELLRRLGKLAAIELMNHLREGMTVAIAWGVTLWEMVHAMPSRMYPNIRVVQCLGALGNRQSCDTPLIVQRMAQILGAQSFLLYAPLIVESEEARAQLLQQRPIRETLELARRADLLLVGIGTTDAATSSLKRAGYLSDGELEELRRRGAVGDICGHFLDQEGQLVPALEQRLIGITLADIRQIPCVFAVAGGIAKAEAIRAALRSGLIHILVTDKGAAMKVLDRSSSYK
ncbi:MAG: sugar-binding transcriptional regulator [Anaerolineae bacterium]|nr:sugar-binding transcriptional regulator [Anaerolineae bacterium]